MAHLSIRVLAGKHDASYYTGMTGAQMTDFETIGPVNLQG